MSKTVLQNTLLVAVIGAATFTVAAVTAIAGTASTVPALAPATVTVTEQAPAAFGGPGSLADTMECNADAMDLVETDPAAAMRKAAECARIAGL